jgi:hypothetical protein
LDVDALDALCESGGVILVDGRSVHLVRPLEADADQMEFDHRACDAGLAEFVRPRMPGEFPEDLSPAAEATYVLVCEARPGVRFKFPILVAWPDAARN